MGDWMDRFRYYTGWHDVANEEYLAPADPWKLVHVDPADVEYLRVVEIKWGLGRVHGGEWDRSENLRAIRETPVFRGFEQRFEDGADWRETVYFDHAKARIADQGTFRGCGTIEEFLETECRDMDELYESIRREGYRPNRGTVYDRPERVETVHDLEPMVLIGRSGELIWTEGFHRFVIAALLDIEAVPVYVVRRHRRWQRVRDQIASTPAAELSPELAPHVDHPDVGDVLR